MATGPTSSAATHYGHRSNSAAHGAPPPMTGHERAAGRQLDTRPQRHGQEALVVRAGYGCSVRGMRD